MINQITPHDTVALRTWKRLVRNNMSPKNPVHHTVAHKRNRELDEEAHPKLPKKKILVLKDDDMNNLSTEVAKQPC